MGKKEKQKNPTVLMLVVGKNKHLIKKKNNKQVDHAKSKAGTDLELGPSHGHVDPVGV